MPVIATVPRTIRLVAGKVYTDPFGDRVFDVLAYLDKAGVLALMVRHAPDGDQWYSHGLLGDGIEAIPELAALDVDRDWGTTKREAFEAICATLTEHIKGAT